MPTLANEPNALELDDYYHQVLADQAQATAAAVVALQTARASTFVAALTEILGTAAYAEAFALSAVGFVGVYPDPLPYIEKVGFPTPDLRTLRYDSTWGPGATGSFLTIEGDWGTGTATVSLPMTNTTADNKFLVGGFYHQIKVAV